MSKNDTSMLAQATRSDKDNLNETSVPDIGKATPEIVQAGLLPEPNVEWWKFAGLSKRLNKRLIGASDGFDLSNSDWDMKIGMYSLLSQRFIKGTREKVRRGMKGAAGRGTCLGKQALGFTRQNCRYVISNYCRQKKNLIIKRLDQSDPESKNWASILVENKRTGLTETAIARLDFAAWLQPLPARLRTIAQFLATGGTTTVLPKVPRANRPLKHAFHDAPQCF